MRLLRIGPLSRRRRRPRAGGFTMVELLMTMLLLTIVMLGLAALQVGTVRRVTASRRANEATRLCQSILERYRFATTRPAAVGNWVDVANPVTGTLRWNADANGEGPFKVQEYVEAVAVGTPSVNHTVITVKCSWISQDTGDPATAPQTQYVAVSLRRIP